MGGSKELIREILVSGTPEEKKALFNFTIADSDELILKKFKLFARSNYSRFFESGDAPFHDDMLLDYIASYKGENWTEIAFRGASKTSLLKLFLVFALLCDEGSFRKYIKILSKDGKNSKQIVTDVYNLILEVQYIFGNVFYDESKSDRKHAETMGEFDLITGQKLSSGTVGQTQRGHVQDAYRPDWLWFEDIEDRDSVSSITITEKIISKADEAIQGLAINGSYVLTANYISDTGSVQWFINKKNSQFRITPIIDKAGDPIWDRYTPEKIQSLKDGTDDWAGEYLCDPTRVGDKFFDIDRINSQLAEAKAPSRVSGIVRYWEDYMPHHRYGQGDDLSDGVGADSCALALFDFTTGVLAATADTNILAPDLFMYEAVRVGQEFGNSIIAPEINNTCGGIAISVLKEVSYPQVYVKQLFDKVGNVLTTTLGWESNAKTKPMMYYEFRKDYNDGLITIYDERVLKEMKAFTFADLKNAKTGAVTRHFDLLTSVVIAWQMKDVATVGGDVKRFYQNLAGRERKPKGAVS